MVLLGGSALTFIVKGGTVAILAEAEAQAGPIERPPLRLAALRRANLTNIEPFLDGCRHLWRRYVKLGACLLRRVCRHRRVYLGFIVGGYALAGNSGVLLGWTFAAALASSALVVWITLVNLPLPADADGDRGGGPWRPAGAWRGSRSSSASACAKLPASSASSCCSSSLATIASILATAGLGLIAFVPFVGLAMVPLQVAAWLLRGFVFEYLALTALGAYLTHYRYYLHGLAAARVHDTARTSPDRVRMMNYDALLLTRRRSRCRSPPSGGWARSSPSRATSSRSPPVPGADTFPWAEFRTSRASCCPDRRHVLQYGATRGFRPLLELIAGIMDHRGVTTVLDRLLVTTGSQQGLDLVARVLLDPGDVVLVELPTYTGAITAFRNVQARDGGRATGSRRHRSRGARRVHARLVQGRPPRAAPVPRAELPESDRPADRPRQAAALLEWAARRDVLIVEDDPYRELYFEDSAIGSGRAADARPTTPTAGSST